MNIKETNNWRKVRARLFKMVSVGVIDDPINQGYDVISTGALIINLAVSVMATFDNLNAMYGIFFVMAEQLTVLFFGIDYVLRVITAPELYPGKERAASVAKYCFSAAGVIDLLSFLPYYLPVFFPAGIAAFKMFRVVRILRLFRINAYYDSLNVITEVLNSKKQQLLSSVFIIATLMLGSSLCMYSLEHEAQPEVFANAFSGIWWSASTLLTVGYGDIYPVTPLGKFFSICITFLGVGMVAIPTGIISAGFVEQYTQFKQMGESGKERQIQLLDFILLPEDSWTGKTIRDLDMPANTLIAAIRRGNDTIVPRGDVVLLAGDKIVIGAVPIRGSKSLELKEMNIGTKHSWNGFAIRELDISRREFIVLVKRGDNMIVPRGSLILREGDLVYLYKELNEKRA
jgi:voltage-gated potassium channel